MITRRQAEDQAERCFHNHLRAYAATIVTLAVLRSQSFPFVAMGWGLGVLAHGTFLHAIPASREMLLRKAAAKMEDRRVQESKRSNERALAEQTA